MDLFRKLVDAYAGIKRFGMPSLDLMFSLIELGLRIPNELNTVAILRQDLSRMENKSVVAACSPVSDHIPDSFGEGDPFFREKLDQLLLLGNVMDEPTLDTIFNTLAKHLESGDGKTKLSANDTCRYLAQLRSFQPKHFDVILARWVCSHLRSSDRTILLHILPPLIGVGCVTIRSFLSLAKRLSHSANSIPNAADLPADLVGLLVAPDEDASYLDLVSYRFQLAQQEFISRNTEEALGIVCDAAACLKSGDQKSALKHINLETSMVTLMRELLVRNPERTSKYCLQRMTTSPRPRRSFSRKRLTSCLEWTRRKKTVRSFRKLRSLQTQPTTFRFRFVS
jgi:mediator of RNA polymerase II transcription subunit 12